MRAYVAFQKPFRVLVSNMFSDHWALSMWTICIPFSFPSFFPCWRLNLGIYYSNGMKSLHLSVLEEKEPQ